VHAVVLVCVIMIAFANDVTLVGSSSPMRQLRALIATVAPTRVPVLIEGETGTGKELVAALLHRSSGRSGEFVAFNVCAIGDSMFEDALFGHTKGAYTGALSESLGFLREANGGTAFLDEISGLPLALQAKLLRAIETGVFRPIGASRDARSDFRPIAATNESLTMLVDAGRFRADLRHRLSGIVLRLPSLTERADDIPELVAHFIRATGRALQLSADALTLLQETPWPGNVRELKQVVDSAVVFARTALDREAVETAMIHRTPASRTRISGGARLAERTELVHVLERADWNAERAATTLGIHRATMYRRLKRHGIDVRAETLARANRR